MFGLGTLINTACIVAGGAGGALFGARMKDNARETLTLACGVSVICIGIAGAMEGMLKLADGGLSSGNSMLLTVCLAFGALIGEWIDFERLFVRFGEWLKKKTGNVKDARFTDAFVTASLTVCIGAMAIVGSIEDGISGDPSILVTKGILDLIIVMVMTCSLGRGCVFSAVPVFVLEGAMTCLARLLTPVMTDAALANLSMVGSVLILMVGINLVFDRKIRVANMLPALLFAAAYAFLQL